MPILSETNVNVMVVHEHGVMFLKDVIYVASFPGGDKGFYFGNGSSPEIIKDVLDITEMDKVVKGYGNRA